MRIGLEALYLSLSEDSREYMFHSGRVDKVRSPGARSAEEGGLNGVNRGEFPRLLAESLGHLHPVYH